MRARFTASVTKPEKKREETATAVGRRPVILGPSRLVGREVVEATSPWPRLAQTVAVAGWQLPGVRVSLPFPLLASSGSTGRAGRGVPLPLPTPRLAAAVPMVEQQQPTRALLGN